MEFNFACPDEDIVKTLAFALDKNDNIQIAHNDNPIDTHNMAQILGEAIGDVLKNDGTTNDFVEKRDTAHEILRIFASALGVDLLAANWQDLRRNPPFTRDVVFVLKSNEYGDYPRDGWYDVEKECFYDNASSMWYKVDDVAYWMPYPETPVQKTEKEE